MLWPDTRKKQLKKEWIGFVWWYSPSWQDDEMVEADYACDFGKVLLLAHNLKEQETEKGVFCCFPFVSFRFSPWPQSMWWCYPHSELHSSVNPLHNYPQRLVLKSTKNPTNNLGFSHLGWCQMKKLWPLCLGAGSVIGDRRTGNGKDGCNLLNTMRKKSLEGWTV